MHTSTFRYGDKMYEPAVPSRGSSEVRISYFDPRTGEPCATKPKPLGRKKVKLTNAEKDAARLQAQDEAAQIMRNMEERKKGMTQYKRKSYMRPVLVDGTRYESVRAAAQKIGTTPEWLGVQLKKGVPTVKGHRVAFAEVVA